MNSFKLLANRITAYSPPLQDGAGEETEGTVCPEVTVDQIEDKDDPLPSPTPREPEEDVVPGSDDASVEQELVSSPEGLLWTSRVIMAILFFPNYMIIHPILLIYHFVAIPSWFTLKKTMATDVVVEEPRMPAPAQTSLRSQVLTALRPRSSLVALDDSVDISEPAESYVDPVKLLLCTQKYIIPSPLRLYPRSRNPERPKPRKKLVLDLDETLIHSLLRSQPRLAFSGAPLPKVVEIQLNGLASLYYVYKRPHCDYFLLEISKWYELQIFTASVREYADPIIDWLENTIRAKRRNLRDTPVFTKRYYRDHCTLRKGVGYVKDLSKFFAADELKSVVILDNSPVLYALHEDNAVMIEGWINDQHDRDLLNLLPMLRLLSRCIDVRYILGLRSGDKMFGQANPIRRP